MAANRDLTDTLRRWGVRKKLAREIGKLDGNKRRSGAKGEERARQAADDLTAAAKRRSSAKRGANTRAKVARARTSSR